MAVHRTDKEPAMTETVDALVDDARPGDAGELIRLDGAVDPLLSQWARFRDLFAAELGPSGFWTIEELEQRIAHRRAFFFPGKSAALVGQIEVYPGGERVFQFLHAVGEDAELAELAPGCEALARMMGCTASLVDGDESLIKLLEPLGYKLWSVTLHKAL